VVDGRVLLSNASYEVAATCASRFGLQLEIVNKFFGILQKVSVLL